MFKEQCDKYAVDIKIAAMQGKICRVRLDQEKLHQIINEISQRWMYEAFNAQTIAEINGYFIRAVGSNQDIELELHDGSTTIVNFKGFEMQNNSLTPCFEYERI